MKLVNDEEVISERAYIQVLREEDTVAILLGWGYFVELTPNEAVALAEKLIERAIKA